MTPAVAVRRVGSDALLVQRPQSPVVHVGVSPERRRARQAPFCGQHGKRWAATVSTTRRLCGRCERRVLKCTRAADLTAQELAGEVAACSTVAQLDQVIHLIVMAEKYTATAVLTSVSEGQRVSPLHAHVAIARIRILGAGGQQRKWFA